jgi:hypothetical protein
MCCDRTVSQKYRPVLHQSSGESFPHGRAVLWTVLHLRREKLSGSSRKLRNMERSNLNSQDVRGAEITVTDLDGTWLRNSFKILFYKSDEWRERLGRPTNRLDDLE